MKGNIGSETLTRALFRLRRIPSPTDALIIIHHPNPFCDSLRSSQDPDSEKERDFVTTIPDKYSLNLAKALMKQLRDCWRRGDIDMDVAKATVRGPLLKLVDFSVDNVKEGMTEDEECLEWHHLKKREVV